MYILSVLIITSQSLTNYDVIVNILKREKLEPLSTESILQISVRAFGLRKEACASMCELLSSMAYRLESTNGMRRG